MQPLSLTDQNGFFRSTFGPELGIGDLRYIAPLSRKSSELGLPFYVDCNLANYCTVGQNEFFLTSFSLHRNIGISYEFFSEPEQGRVKILTYFPKASS